LNSGPPVPQTVVRGTRYRSADLAPKWFATDEAKRYVVNVRNGNVETVFGFAKSMSEGYAFIARHHQGENTHFVGYEAKLTIVPGMVLLDATADIDGVSQIAPWCSHIAVPRALYDNLTIVHVEPCTRKRLANFLRCLPDRGEYVAWMKEVVKANMDASTARTGLSSATSPSGWTGNRLLWLRPRYSSTMTFAKEQ